MNIKIDEITIIDITTIFLAIATFILAYYTYGIIKDTQKGRKIIFYERKLEKLYYPLQNVFKKFDTYLIYDDIEKFHDKSINVGDRADIFISIVGKYSHFRKDSDGVIQYLYLDSDNLQRLLDEFLAVFEDYDVFMEILNLDKEKRHARMVTILNDKDNSYLNDKKMELNNLYDQIIVETNKKIEHYKLELDKLLNENVCSTDNNKNCV